MNFLEAVKAMKEGKKVRRSGFTNKINWTAGISDYEATDWEIYSEQTPFVLADKTIINKEIDSPNTIDICKVEDIKTTLSNIEKEIDNFKDRCSECNMEHKDKCISPINVKEIIKKNTGEL